MAAAGFASSATVLYVRESRKSLFPHIFSLFLSQEVKKTLYDWPLGKQ